MKKTVLITMFCLLLTSVTATFADDQTAIPSEAQATAADQALVKALGPNRGAVNLTSDIRTIKGLAAGISGGGSNITSNVVDLNQTISDLGGRIEGKLLFLQLSADVLFDFDKATIKPAAADALGKVALVINKKAKGPVSIIGHTDSKGTEEYNQSLSLRRAEATREWLTNQGGTTAEYKVEGRGESEPVAENTRPDGSDNPEGRAKNRRVDIIVQVEEGN